ncbi:hypothetical protein J6590_087809 [Homalodisca vitripennis]|nr:hypothetical protein J6590_087809 [Homalodisca vitripennis]
MSRETRNTQRYEARSVMLDCMLPRTVGSLRCFRNLYETCVYRCQTAEYMSRETRNTQRYEARSVMLDCMLPRTVGSLRCFQNLYETCVYRCQTAEYMSRETRNTQRYEARSVMLDCMLPQLIQKLGDTQVGQYNLTITRRSSYKRIRQTHNSLGVMHSTFVIIDATVINLETPKSASTI